jgi:hypothetical protein
MDEMEVNCTHCGSMCRVDFEEDEATELQPLFCPFCGESVDPLVPISDEDLDEDEESLDYLGKLFTEGRPDV